MISRWQSFVPAALILNIICTVILIILFSYIRQLYILMFFWHISIFLPLGMFVFSCFRVEMVDQIMGKTYISHEQISRGKQ